jgi:hypothetical protein
MEVSEYKALVDEMFDMERRLEVLGRTTVNTSQGPYMLGERNLDPDRVPQQAEYDALYERLKERRRIVKAIDLVARYELSRRPPC